MGAKRRAGSGVASLVEQGIVSGSAFLGVLALAGVLSAAEFGTFAIPFTLLTLAVGVGRAYFGVPISLLRADPAGVRRLRDQSASAMLIVGAPVAVVVAGAGVLAALPGGVTATEVAILVAVGVATPFAVIVDICRYTETVEGRVRASLAADAVWLAGAVALLVFRDVLSPGFALAGWAGVIIACAIVHLGVVRPRLDAVGGRQLLRPAARLGDALALTVVLATGVTLVMAALMLVVLGPVAVAAIRGAGTLFGPVNTAIAALDLAVLSGMAASPEHRLRSAIRPTVVLTTAAGTWWVILLTLPAAVGEVLLGATWSPTREILPITGLEYLLLCLAAGLALLSKADAGGRDLLVNRIGASTAILVVAGAALALGGGVVWMALALLAGAIVSAAHLLVVASRAVAAGRHLSPEGGESDRAPGAAG